MDGGLWLDVMEGHALVVFVSDSGRDFVAMILEKILLMAFIVLDRLGSRQVTIWQAAWLVSCS